MKNKKKVVIISVISIILLLLSLGSIYYYLLKNKEVIHDVVFTLNGEEVFIDGSKDNVIYKPLCGKCYIEKVLKFKK